MDNSIVTDSDSDLEIIGYSKKNTSISSTSNSSSSYLSDLHQVDLLLDSEKSSMASDSSDELFDDTEASTNSKIINDPNIYDIILNPEIYSESILIESTKLLDTRRQSLIEQSRMWTSDIDIKQFLASGVPEHCAEICSQCESKSAILQRGGDKPEKLCWDCANQHKKTDNEDMLKRKYTIKTAVQRKVLQKNEIIDEIAARRSPSEFYSDLLPSMTPAKLVVSDSLVKKWVYIPDMKNLESELPYGVPGFPFIVN